MALAALLAAVVVLSITGQAQHAPGQVTVLSPESYPLAGGTQQILDLAASALLPGYAFAQSVALDLTPTGSITDIGALELKGPRGIATFTSGGSTYAAVAAGTDSGVQILNITDPRNIAAAGSTADRDDAELGGAWGIATFTSGGSTYAAVAAFNGNAVQILDVTEPSNVFPAGSIAGGALKLNSPRGIAIFNSTGGTYAAVAASGSNGVQILNVTDPYSITAAGSIAGGALKLSGARGIATFTSGGDTYAAVAASGSKGVQILNVTDPTSITAAGSIAGDDSPALDGARAIAIFESGSGTYAAVAATFDDGIQILNVTDPYSVTAAGSITDTGDLELKRPWGIATFTSGNSTYAAVAAYEDNAVQILDVTDPSSITAAGSVTNTGDLELDGPQAIAIFESGGGTYAAVAAQRDDGVQIIHLAGNNAPTVDAGPDQTVSEGEPVSLPWSAGDEDGDDLMHAWSQSPADPAITLVSPDSSPTTFTAPLVDSRTVIRLTLTASDGTASSSDTLRVIITDPSDIPLTAAGSIIDTDDLRLKGALGVAVFASGGSTYAAVTAFNEGVQILNVTDPYNIAAAGSIANTDTLELDGAVGIAIFESGGGTYAAVTASGSKGVQILNVTDPYNIAAAGSIANTDTLELDGADGIAVFESDGGTYAAVVAHNDDGVQILNVTDPSNVVAAGSINSTGAPELDGPRDIAIFASGGRTYAAVASSDSNGVQILNVTDPSNVVAAGSINSTGAPKLDGSQNIAVFVSGSSTYAAVAAYRDNAVQILNITDPSDITAAGSITDADAPRLQVPRGIAVFVSGSSTYAAVAAHNGNAVQVLNVTDPSSITAAGRIGDNKARVLGGAWGIATFTSGGGTYAAVTADTDDGVQIIRLAGDAPPVTPNSPPTADAGADQTVAEGSTVSLGGTASDADPGDTLTYLWTHGSVLGISIANSDSASASFVAPNVAADTAFTVTLTVNDGTASASDTLQVTITDSPNSPPEVEAGADQTVAEGATVTLSGTVSDDDPEDALTYEWTHDSALAITITGSDSLSASFAAPDVAADTAFTFTLTVNDGTDSGSDQVTVTITDAAAVAIRPVPVLSAPQATNSVPIRFGVDFGVTIDASSFQASDIGLSGGSGWTAGNISRTDAAGRYFGFTVTSDRDGDVTVSIPAGRVSDPLGAPNHASNTLTVRLDRAAPQPRVTAETASPTNSQEIRFALDFGEEVEAGSLGSSDIAVDGGRVASPPSGTDGRNFAFSVSPHADGRVTVSLPAGAALDLAGNPSAASNRASAVYDGTGPGLAAAYLVSPGRAAVLFNELVDAAATDGSGFAVDGAQPASNTDPALRSSVITLGSPGLAAGGFLTYSAASGSVTDAAGNEANSDGLTVEAVVGGAVTQPDRNPQRFELPPEVVTVNIERPGLPPEMVTQDRLSLNFSDILDSNGTANSAYLSDSAVNLTATVGGVRITVSLPAGATVTGDSSWDGLLGLPAPSGAAPPAPGQFTVHTKRVTFSVGADTTLHVDRAVRILVSGEGGRNVFFSGPEGAPRAVPECAFGDSQEAADAGLTAGGDCHIDVGRDLAIWTRHLSHWGTYHAGPRVIEQEPETESEAPADDAATATGGGGGGGSRGGGGGGGGAPAEIITDVRIYSVSWDCAAGSVTVTAGPDTDQLSVSIRTSSVGERPVTRADGTLHGIRAFTSSISGADEFVVVEASLAHEGGHVTTKIVNLRQCTGTVGFDRYEPPRQAVPEPEPEPQELCRDGRAPALRDGNELLCLFPGTFEVLVERGWNLARP